MENDCLILRVNRSGLVLHEEGNFHEHVLGKPLQVVVPALLVQSFVF